MEDNHRLQPIYLKVIQNPNANEVTKTSILVNEATSMN